jgi:hypothetical protein
MHAGTLLASLPPGDILPFGDTPGDTEFRQSVHAPAPGHRLNAVQWSSSGALHSRHRLKGARRRSSCRARTTSRSCASLSVLRTKYPRWTSLRRSIPLSRVRMVRDLARRQCDDAVVVPVAGHSVSSPPCAVARELSEVAVGDEARMRRGIRRRVRARYPGLEERIPRPARRRAARGRTDRAPVHRMRSTSVWGMPADSMASFTERARSISISTSRLRSASGRKSLSSS